MSSDEVHLKTADLLLSVSRQQVHKNKQAIKLPHLSFKTLLALVQAAPHHLSIDALIDEVWQTTSVSPETVTQRIAMLRKALAADGEPHDKYIVSVRSQGYRWAPAVSTVSTGPKFRWYGLVGLLLIAVTVVWLLLSGENPLTSKSTNAPQPVIQATLSGGDYTQQAWRYLGKHDARNNQVAIELFRKALADKPNHVDALAGLSMALSHQVTKFNQSEQLLEEARSLAEQALKLDPENHLARGALAFTYDADGQVSVAISHYQQALQLAPQNASIASSLAYLHGVKGQFLDAMRLNLQVLGSRQLYLDLQIAQVLDLLGFDAVAELWYHKADELSPDNVFATHLRARYYLSRHQQQQAQSVVDAALSRGVARPELHVVAALLHWLKQDLPAAQEAARTAVQINADDMEAQLLLFVLSYPSGAPPAAAQAFAEQWISQPFSWPDIGVYQAIFYAHQGQDQQALDSLNLAYEAGYRNHRWLNVLPPLHRLKSQLSWLNLMEAMQADVSSQRQVLLQADWLPTGFLDPLNR